ncbi:MAG: flagellar hook-length control protein FliK [Planctomycetota bacterium]
MDTDAANNKTVDRQKRPVETSKKPADDLAPDNVVTPIQVRAQPVVVEQPKLRPEDCPALVSDRKQDAVPVTATLPAVSSPTVPASLSQIPQSSPPQNPVQNPGAVVQVADAAKPDAATKVEPALAEKSPIPNESLHANSGGETNPVVTTTAISPGSNPASIPIQENPESDSKSVQPNETVNAASELPSNEVASVKGDLEEALQAEKAQAADTSVSTTESVSQPMDQTAIDSRPAAFATAMDGARAGLTAFRQFRNELTSKINVAFQSSGGIPKGMSFLQDLIPESGAAKSAPATNVADKSETFTKFAGLEFGAPQHTQVQESTPQTSTGPLDSAAVPVPMESFVHRMTEIVQQRLEGSPEADKSSVVLRLDPPDLGRLNVHLSISNDVVSIRMVATDEAARQAIERQLGNLHQSLDSQGVAFTPCQVECQTQGQNSSNQAPFHQGPDDVLSVPFGQTRNPLTAASVQAYARSRSALDYVA